MILDFAERLKPSVSVSSPSLRKDGKQIFIHEQLKLSLLLQLAHDLGWALCLLCRAAQLRGLFYESDGKSLL